MGKRIYRINTTDWLTQHTQHLNQPVQVLLKGGWVWPGTYIGPSGDGYLFQSCYGHKRVFPLRVISEIITDQKSPW